MGHCLDWGTWERGVFCRDTGKVPLDKPGTRLGGEVSCPAGWPRLGLYISECPAEMVPNSLERLMLGTGGRKDRTGQGVADVKGNQGM